MADYAIDFGPKGAVFSVFRRAAEQPVFSIWKWVRPRAAAVLTIAGALAKRARLTDIVDTSTKSRGWSGRRAEPEPVLRALTCETMFLFCPLIQAGNMSIDRPIAAQTARPPNASPPHSCGAAPSSAGATGAATMPGLWTNSSSPWDRIS